MPTFGEVTGCTARPGACRPPGPRQLYAAAAAQDRAGSLIEAGALRALTLAASAEEAEAVNALAGTLTLASPQGHVRVFADEGPPMAALLGRLISAQRTGQAAASVPLGYLARLRSAFGAEPAAPHAAAVPGLIDPLTSRELEVLTMLAAGRSNQAIAGQLVITLDTVKKHVSHIMGKLGAASRTEAVARARQLGVIPSGAPLAAPRHPALPRCGPGTRAPAGGSTAYPLSVRSPRIGEIMQ